MCSAAGMLKKYKHDTCGATRWLEPVKIDVAYTFSKYAALTNQNEDNGSAIVTAQAGTDMDAPIDLHAST